jgi:cold shock protein
MATGTVIFFHQQKCYGFVKNDDGGTDIYLHGIALARAGLMTIADGQRVSFDTEIDRKSGRLRAANLALLQ